MFLTAVCPKESQHNNNKLLKEHLYLIDKIVRNFRNVSETHETLETVGYIGLLNAVNLYNRKVADIDFKSYAQLFITNEIYQYLTDRKYKINQLFYKDKRDTTKYCLLSLCYGFTANSESSKIKIFPGQS